MAMMTAAPRARFLVIALAALTLPLAAAGQQPPRATAPRFLDGAPPAQNPLAVGGGEVILELGINAGGGVQQVRQVRDTPPFGEALTAAVRTWRFEPGTATVDGRSGPASSPALVVGVFRAPTLYPGPTLGTPPSSRAEASSRLPRVEALTPPNHPPNSIGEGVVLIEIEMTATAVPRGYKVLSPESGFDGAALDAVRLWRFAAPREPVQVDAFFVYAVLGFRPSVVSGRPLR
jgi:outer membrane biosynthesis protein TonB